MQAKKISLFSPKFSDASYWYIGLGLSLSYFVLAKFGLNFTTVANNVTLIWPPTGLALFALLVFGMRFWPWIAVAAFVTNFTTSLPLLPSISIAIGNTLEAVVAVTLLRLFNFDNHLSRVRDVLMLVILAAVLSTMVSSTIGALSLTLFDIIPWHEFGRAWTTWWMGDSMGDLVFATLFLSFWFKERNTVQRGHMIEIAILLISLAAVTQFVFGDQQLLGNRQLPLAFMTFPFLTWASLRFGMRGATSVVFLIGAMILFNIIFHQGPFSQGSTFESLSLLWMYTNFIAITSLVLAAAISERYIAETNMRHLAQHDHLTGLSNRIALTDRIEYAINLADRQKKSFALLFLDVDRFKVINDSLGHPVGDEMLKQISLRLLGCVRKEDTVSRLGGDEFVILVSEITRPEEITKVAKKIINAIREPINIKNTELHTSVSVGICIYPEDGKNVDTLLKHADIAMYRAKDIGRDTHLFYSADMNIQAEQRLSIENDLRKAIDKNEFFLNYQPQFDTQEQTIKAAEALLRWRKSDGTVISPDNFIPILEETGQINVVGAWVLNEACSQLANWHAAGWKGLRISVNLSSYQLNDQNLVNYIAELLEKYNLPADSLELEITESMLVRNDDQIEKTFEQLVGLGIRLAVDDFGTGYSSLSYLHRLSIDTLKIDRSFIEKIPGNKNSEAIARAIVGLGKSLNLTLIAEGVEN
ncbi:MAG: putative bifunctional diguanylate cyclase/phosphodiesterase, partial [Gammaproteobacteria bacterium]